MPEGDAATFGEAGAAGLAKLGAGPLGLFFAAGGPAPRRNRGLSGSFSSEVVDGSGEDGSGGAADAEVGELAGVPD
jgi:hypothetical protein